MVACFFCYYLLEGDIAVPSGLLARFYRAFLVNIYALTRNKIEFIINPKLLLQKPWK